MNRSRTLILVLLLVSMIVFCCGCEDLWFTEEISLPTKVEEKVEEPEEEPELIQIADLDEAWNTILNGSTRGFIGGHPIDEGFLSFVTSRYGEDCIEEIASYANFSTPDIWYECLGKSIHVLWYEYCQKTSIQNYSFENIYVRDSSSDDEIVIDFTGDFTLADNVATTNFMDQQMNGIKDCFSEDLLTEMRSADILMVNNEFAYTDRGEALEGKAYTFRANPGRVNLLTEIGVDVVGIANNHVYDYGEIGMTDTLETLDNYNMPYVGAGYNLEDAMKPVYYIVGGRKIAICAATQIERSYTYTKMATPTSPGVLKCLKPEYFIQEIKKAKENADICIVFVHWGTEGNAIYGSDQELLARQFVEAGADVIIGGHTHCLQTVEYLDDVPIYYSLGNYYFSTTGNMPKAYDTGIAQIRIGQDKNIEAYFIPCHFSNGVTSIVQEDENKSSIINRLNSISDTAVINDNGLITKKQSE